MFSLRERFLLLLFLALVSSISTPPLTNWPTRVSSTTGLGVTLKPRRITFLRPFVGCLRWAASCRPDYNTWASRTSPGNAAPRKLDLIGIGWDISRPLDLSLFDSFLRPRSLRFILCVIINFHSCSHEGLNDK